MEPLILVSADSHCGAPLEAYRPFLDEQYRPALDEVIASGEEKEWIRVLAPISDFSDQTLDVIDDQGAIRSGGHDGAWDTERRLKEMDREGVAASVLIAGHGWATLPFFSNFCLPCGPELRAAGARAYHRWLAEHMEDANGRLIGVADPGPCLDLDETVKDLRWVAEHGYTSVFLPGYVHDPDLPPLSSSYYEPFWAACADLGLSLNIHAGWSRPQGYAFPYLGQIADIQDELMESDDWGTGACGVLGLMASRQMGTSPLAMDLGPRQGMWQVMLGGVFDRYPDLKLVLTEVRADWVPATLAHLDRRFEAEGVDLARKPSEYWRSNCRVAASSIHPCEIDMRGDIGVETIMFGVDFPHAEGTWPNTLDWIRAAFATVPQDEARLILGETAIDTFRFDREALTAIAGRIGPKADEVLGGDHRVDPRRIELFDKRAGFSYPAEQVDPAAIDELLDPDLRHVTANA